MAFATCLPSGRGIPARRTSEPPSLRNTWHPRPVVGTQGLKPVAWHRVVEQWGAAQLQSRFDKLSGRWMTSEDYAAWAAVRSVAEAVTRTKSNELKTVNNFNVYT